LELKEVLEELSIELLEDDDETLDELEDELR